jgi:hypothetical protein
MTSPQPNDWSRPQRANAQPTRAISRRCRPVTAAAGVLASAVLLSGCFTIRSAITINDDETVDIAITQLVDLERLESLASIFGEDVGDLSDATGEDLVEEITEGDDACGGLIDQFGDRVGSREVSEGARRGVECTVSGVPLGEFTSFGDDDSTITIDIEGDRTTVEMTLGGLEDFTEPDAEEAEFLAALGLSLEELFDVSFTVDAPGGLVTSNATSTEGSVATWQITPDAAFIVDGRAVMTAEWSSTGATSDTGVPVWLIILGAATVAAVIAAAIGATRRRGGVEQSAVPAPPPPDAPGSASPASPHSSPPSAPPPPTS